VNRFDDQLRSELHREFDAQVVVTPPPHRSRYGQLRAAARRRPPLRTVALVTAVFAIGILAGLVYDTRGAVVPRHLGVVPVEMPTDAVSAVPTVQAVPTASAPQARRPASPPPRQTAAPSAPPAAPALGDDFESDPGGTAVPAGWRVDDGEWTGVVDDGGHVVRHGAGAGGHLVAGSPAWTDYTVSAEVTTELLDLGFAGVAGRYQGPGDDYECGVSVGGQLQLWVVQGGQRRSLGHTSLSLDLASRHTVGLDLRGSRLTCSLDGAPLVRATDATFASGRIALVASTGEAADFDDVRVLA
jgi:hypothetical protein